MKHLFQVLALIAMAWVVAGCPAETEDLCGNDKLDGDEECDGKALDNKSCSSEGFSYGEMKCSSSCKLETSQCVDDPCWDYPCEPYGAATGQIIDDLQFIAANDAAADIAGDGENMWFHDIYQQNAAHGGEYIGMMMFVSTGWCPYCGDEAAQLEAVYHDLKAQGILLLGVLTQDNRGRPADKAFATGYAAQYGWSFPAVAGNLTNYFWIPGDDAGAVPMHMFFDLRNMRVYGRITGVADVKIIRYALQDLIDGPEWGNNGERDLSFDCAPGTGTETEPNDGETPEVASSLPYTLSGVQCPPAVAEGLLLDQDFIDLGELTAGTVIDVSMEATNGSKVYPNFQVMRPAGGGTWVQMGPTHMGGTAAGRQVIADETGRFLVASLDGRSASGMYYGQGVVPPVADGCCEGGPDYTYEINVSTFTLAATEPALELATSRGDAMDSRNLKVYPFAATAGETYTFELTAASTAQLDPYLVLYDPDTSDVIDYNDDRDAANEDYNSRIVWQPSNDQDVWVVPSYFSAVYRGGEPQYSLEVTN